MRTPNDLGLAPYPPALDTPNLRLRVWKREDATALRVAIDANDAHLRPFIPFMRDEPRTLEQTLARIDGFARSFAEAQEFRYALWRRATGGAALVGEAMLRVVAAPGGLELGYWLCREATGRGWMTEAARALLVLAFTAPDLVFMEAQCDVRNGPSNGVAQRLGGRLVEHRTVDEGAVTLAVWRWERGDLPTHEATGARPTDGAAR